MDKPKEKVLGTYEIAQRCHVTPSTVFRWIKTGKLKAFQTGGGRNRVLESDFKSFVRSLNIPKALRVLIVDDNLPSRRLIRRLIENRWPQVEIDEAVDGYGAGFKTRDFRPSLVILDLLLPCINGIKVCRMIRKSSELKNTKILAVTGYRVEKLRRVILKAGADEFIAKPFSQEEFVRKVSRLL